MYVECHVLHVAAPQVPPPSQSAAVSILRVHTRSMPLSSDVSLESVAAACPAYTGAELANVCREAAIHALTRDKETAHVVTAHG